MGEKLQEVLELELKKWIQEKRDRVHREKRDKSDFQSGGWCSGMSRQRKLLCGKLSGRILSGRHLS